MNKKLSKYQKWAKKNPKRAAYHNKRRRLRRDNRTPTLWHRRLHYLRLHCGEFFSRKRDVYYQDVEIRLTVIEVAVVWFRDKAWTLKKAHLDRIDPNGHYEFDNVRFVDPKINLERRRKKNEVPF